MYESYWQLTRKPFEHGADASFYFPSETHRAVQLQLRYAIETEAAAALLVGPGGVGKTLLVQLLKADLPEQFQPIAHLVFPQMPADELLAYLADELGTTSTGDRSTRDSVRRIQQRLQENAAAGRHAVVIVDEAHLLEEGRALEALRLLLNFEANAKPCLTLLLVGQPPLLGLVDRCPQLEERLAVKSVLRAFSLTETSAYVSHRLAAAGVQRPLFDEAALTLLYDESRGLPRRINRLCDLALLVGYAEEQPSIGPEQVAAVSRELSVAVAD